MGLCILGSEAFHLTGIPLMHMYGEVLFNYMILGRFFPRTLYPLVGVFMRQFYACCPKRGSSHVFLALR